jgi:secretion/DNA translocation related TadE-like protein
VSLAQRDDRGAAALWVLACGAIVLAVGLLVLVRSLAVLARHRAESAADLAALAAAARIGVGGDPCAAADAVAAANDARLGSCLVALGPGGRSGTVRVVVIAHADLPVVGGREVSARARAGRLPGGPRPRTSLNPHRAKCCPGWGLWHAVAG